MIMQILYAVIVFGAFAAGYKSGLGSRRSYAYIFSHIILGFAGWIFIFWVQDYVMTRSSDAEMKAALDNYVPPMLTVMRFVACGLAFLGWGMLLEKSLTKRYSTDN